MYDSIDDMPNLIMVDERQEDPDKIIEDYLELVYFHIDDREALVTTLRQLFDEAGDWVTERALIEDAKVKVANLAMFRQERDEFDEELLDEEDED